MQNEPMFTLTDLSVVCGQVLKAVINVSANDFSEMGHTIKLGPTLTNNINSSKCSIRRNW